MRGASCGELWGTGDTKFPFSALFPVERSEFSNALTINYSVPPKSMITMKKILFIALLLPFAFAAKAQFTIVNTSTLNLVELRQGGTWPINLQRVIKESDTSFALQFRDQQYTNEVIMTALRFSDMQQLKYFQKALAVLKNGSTGD